MPPPLKICSRACGVCACLKRLVSEASGDRAARERLPFRARELAEFTARAVSTDVRALPPMLKLMLLLNKRRPGAFN